MVRPKKQLVTNLPNQLLFLHLPRRRTRVIKKRVTSFNCSDLGISQTRTIIALVLKRF